MSVVDGLDRGALLRQVATKLRAGEHPWTAPPPSSPRLLPGTLAIPDGANTSIARAGQWWRGWAEVRSSIVEGWVIAPLSDGRALASQPRRVTVVLEDVQLAILAYSGTGATLGDIAQALRVAELPDHLPAEVFVANSTLALAEAGLIALHPRPKQDPPGIAEYVVPASHPRSVSLVANQATPPGELDRPLVDDGRFSPLRRTGERLVGRLIVKTMHGNETVAIYSDVQAVSNWCDRHGPAAEVPSGSSEVHQLRVLAMPGEAEGCLVMLDDEVTLPVDHEDVLDEMCAMIVSRFGLGQAATTRVRSGWVSADRDRWCLTPEVPKLRASAESWWSSRLWLDDDGSQMSTVDARATRSRFEAQHGLRFEVDSVVAWQRHPLTRLAVSDRNSDPALCAAAALDALRIDTAGSPDRLCEAVAAVANSGRLGKTEARPLDPPPAAISSFDDVGRLKLLGVSAKLSPHRIQPDRSAWWLGTDPRSVDRTETTRRLVEFGLREDVAHHLEDLELGRRRTILGVEADPRTMSERRKVYLTITEQRSWEVLVERMPELALLHSASTISPRVVEGPAPRYVGWKFEMGTERRSTAVYRRAHGQRVTVAEAVQRLLPRSPEWARAALALIALDRSVDSHIDDRDLEVIEDSGRASIDLAFHSASARGDRYARAAWLAALAELPASDVGGWVEQVSRRPIARFIVGRDGDGDPFCSAYFLS